MKRLDGLRSSGTTQGAMTIVVAMYAVGQGLFLQNIIIELLIHFTP